ncbi:MAG TPA: hypothetical protein H9830_01935, partial [Candidatus Agrococcus pullicola]|nr:hypothetical protein [Candidatus Agrococcus pullicola]
GVQFPDRPPITHTPIAHPKPGGDQSGSPQAPPGARPGADQAPIDAVPQQWSRRNPPPNSGTPETEQRVTPTSAADPGQQRWSRRNPPPVSNPTAPSPAAPSGSSDQQQWSRRNPPPVVNPMQQPSTPEDERREP